MRSSFALKARYTTSGILQLSVKNLTLLLCRTEAELERLSFLHVAMIQLAYEKINGIQKRENLCFPSSCSFGLCIEV